jgi:hypothetical protein
MKGEKQMRQPYPNFIQNKLEEIKIEGGVRTVSDDTYTYIILAAGERPTGGYEVKVVDVTETKEPREVHVKAKELKPGPGDFVIQVITYPTAVYRIPKTDKPVRVEWVRT